MSSGRACVSTWMVTSSGTRLLLDDFAHEIEIGLRRGGKSDLDFLEADFHQHVEHAALAGRIHRFDQRLVAVAQIHAAPRRRRGDDAAGPGPVGRDRWGERHDTWSTDYATWCSLIRAKRQILKRHRIVWRGFEIFRSCKRRPVARGMWRLAAQQQGKRTRQRSAAGGFEWLARLKRAFAAESSIGAMRCCAPWRNSLAC